MAKISGSYQALEAMDKAIEMMIKGNNDMDDRLFDDGLTGLREVRKFVKKMTERIGNFGLPDGWESRNWHF